MQSWVDGSAGNFGILLGNSATGDGADFTASESTTAANRPLLSVVYSVAAGGDNIAPSVPTGLVETGAGETTASFTWSASTDNVGVSGYNVFRDSVKIASTSVTSYTDSGLAPDTAYSYTISAYDAALNESAQSSPLVIATDPAPGFVDYLATTETPFAGSVGGVYTDTHADDGAYQSVSERESGGKKQNRYSYLEHRWTFNISAGAIASLHANAWSSGSADNDGFAFEVSDTGNSYSRLFTINSTSADNQQSAVITGSPTGTVYIRVVDTDRTPGNRSADTVFVDKLYIRISDPSADPPDGDPTDMSAAAVSFNQIDLAWTDGSNNETGYKVERSPDGLNGWTEIDDLGPDSESYSDTGLVGDTAYFYQVIAYNANGFSEPATANATTLPAPAITLSATGYKVKGKHYIDLDWTGSGSVDIYRGGGLIAEGVVGSGYTDATGGKGSATYTHRVCEAGSDSECSNLTTTVF